MNKDHQRISKRGSTGGSGSGVSSRTLPLPPQPEPHRGDSGQYLPAPPGIERNSNFPDQMRRSGENLPARSAQSAVGALDDRSRSPIQSAGGVTLTPGPNHSVTVTDHDIGDARSGSEPYDSARHTGSGVRSVYARLTRELKQTSRRNAIHRTKWVEDQHYRLRSSNRGMTYQLHQPFSVEPWEALNWNDPPPRGPPRDRR